jgi:hypothetical protein
MTADVIEMLIVLILIIIIIIIFVQQLFIVNRNLVFI